MSSIIYLARKIIGKLSQLSLENVCFYFCTWKITKFLEKSRNLFVFTGNKAKESTIMDGIQWLLEILSDYLLNGEGLPPLKWIFTQLENYSWYSKINMKVYRHNIFLLIQNLYLHITMKTVIWATINRNNSLIRSQFNKSSLKAWFPLWSNAK